MVQQVTARRQHGGNPVDQLLLQSAQVRDTVCTFADGQGQRFSKTHDAGYIFRTAPPPAFLRTALDERPGIRVAGYDQAANALGAVKFMCRDAEHVHPGHHPFPVEPAGRLHGV